MRLERVAIVLFRPQIPENIGAVARAACNMGITQLHVVDPGSLDQERMRMMATSAAFHLIEGMTVHDDLAAALGPFQYVVGSTARLGGIRKMRDVPDLLYVVDVRREATAVHEANILGVQVVALVDTNCDPDLIDYIIPSNDDAIRAIKLITTKMADAVLEGIAMRKATPELEDEMAEAFVDEDERYLGEATLAKLRAGELEFSQEEAAEQEAQPEDAPVAFVSEEETQVEETAEAESEPETGPESEAEAQAE